MAERLADIEDEALPPIVCPYLLCLNVQSYRDARGVRYFDLLWLKDLQQHTRYLKNLTVAAPCHEGDPPGGAVAWNPLPTEIQFIDLPSPARTVDAIRQVASTALRIWKAIGHCEIVHLGVAGHPIPLGWIAGPIAIVRRKPYVIVVESAPWRLRPELAATWKAKVRARISEILSRWCVNRGSLVILTQEGYRKTLLTRAPQSGHIIHASWIDEEQILSPREADESWRAKTSAVGALRILFAGRLERSKGVMVLLDAMRLLVRDACPIELDILGDGELLDVCRDASTSWGAGKIRTMGAIAYDAEFFRLMRGYHAVAVPSLSDEQPRIVYDAYSQAVPILAGDTTGLRDCVQHGKTGLISQGVEPESWAALLRSCLNDLEALQWMGEAGLEIAREMTHSTMHRKRWRLLLNLPACRKGIE